MFIHADFSQLVIIRPEQYNWVKSPHGEVDRMRLDRMGEEKARATSLVKYAPESKFPEHSHPLGEEVLVLSGIFTENDEQHYPTGWYLRNPHGSTHRVSSQSGCLIFVKLMQMTEEDQHPIRINTHDPAHWHLDSDRMICPLFQSDHEYTFLEKLRHQQSISTDSAGGMEILILQGQLRSGTQCYPAGTWMRFPINSDVELQAETGATLYVKTGHLQHTVDVWGTHKNTQ